MRPLHTRPALAFALTIALAACATPGQRAAEMGHIPVGSEQGTLRQLAGLTSSRRMYIHINNTNPMLNEASSEFHAVRDAGWELAEDGCQLTL